MAWGHGDTAVVMIWRSVPRVDDHVVVGDDVDAGIVSRETHVHGAGICFRCGLEVGASLDSMNHRCPSMRFYDAKMGVYEL